jgi:hypothetical protein
MPLWHVIMSSRPALLAGFVSKLGKEASARDLPCEQIPAEITGLLEQLTVSLRAAEIGRNATLLPAARDLAANLGEARAHEGRNIEAVVSDFLALHEAILEVANKADETISPQEHRALARGINRAIASAVARYAQARDRELQRTHAEHFAFLAHELRTPLSNIRMGVDLLDEGLDASALVPRVRRAAERMRELIDNEITSARLSAGGALRTEPVPLADLLRAVVDELRMQAHDREIQVALGVPDKLDLHADPRLLRSIFTNLLANAVKFTRRGGCVAVRAREEDDTIVCEVADSCGGLPEGTASKMFQAFRQTGTDRTGFGLGLAIVSEAVGLHGGTLRVDNRPGEGCSMVVELPRTGKPRQ